MKGLLAAGIIGLISLGFFHGSAKMPDGRDANLMHYVFVAISEITQNQVEYSTVGTEAVRALIHEKAPWMRRHTSEPGVIRHRHGGTIEVIPIDQNRRLRLRLTGLPESACIAALWGKALSGRGSSDLPTMERTPTPLFPRGVDVLNLRAEPPFSGSWILTAEEKEQLAVAQVLAICSSSKNFFVDVDFRERMAVTTKAPWD